MIERALITATFILLIWVIPYGVGALIVGPGRGAYTAGALVSILGVALIRWSWWMVKGK